ncbi:uncharacterized protein EI90DRAFT_3035560, partial [Cantharellus anzutake]|uniref:uncharacterized protein n=1 Tax=Cantharellus anzutake TaxID=1750568 RepID=UPI001906A1BD
VWAHTSQILSSKVSPPPNPSHHSGIRSLGPGKPDVRGSIDKWCKIESTRRWRTKQGQPDD